jgi:Flp pilus assembly protein TadG
VRAFTRPEDPADRGSIAPMVAVLGLAFFLLLGLIIDSSRELTARGRAVSYAEEAARAGAQAVQPASDPLVLDEPAAEQRVADYCAKVRAAEAHVTDCAFVRFVGNQVKTHVRIEVPATLLGIVGVTVLPASGDGSAHPVLG